MYHNYRITGLTGRRALWLESLMSQLSMKLRDEFNSRRTQNFPQTSHHPPFRRRDTIFHLDETNQSESGSNLQTVHLQHFNDI